MESNSTTTHLDDGDILHLVDRDASAWELDAWSKHVLACEGCAARLAEQRRAADQVSVALSEVGLPRGFPTAEETMRAARARRGARRPGRSATRSTARPWLRAAALALALALPLALVSPLRAALVEWLGWGWSQLAGGPEREQEAPAPLPAAPEAGYTLYFTPGGPEVEIVVLEPQRGGRLVLTRADASEGSLEVRGGGEETPLLTDAGLTIRNAPTSTATYAVALPAGVERAVVRVAGGPATTVTAAEIAAGWEVDLSGP